MLHLPAALHALHFILVHRTPRLAPPPPHTHTHTSFPTCLLISSSCASSLRPSCASSSSSLSCEETGMGCMCVGEQKGRKHDRQWLRCGAMRCTCGCARLAWLDLAWQRNAMQANRLR